MFDIPGFSHRILLGIRFVRVFDMGQASSIRESRYCKRPNFERTILGISNKKRLRLYRDNASPCCTGRAPCGPEEDAANISMQHSFLYHQNHVTCGIRNGCWRGGAHHRILVEDRCWHNRGVWVGQSRWATWQRWMRDERGPAWRHNEDR